MIFSKVDQGILFKDIDENGGEKRKMSIAWEAGRPAFPYLLLF